MSSGRLIIALWDFGPASKSAMSHSGRIQVTIASLDCDVSMRCDNLARRVVLFKESTWVASATRTKRAPKRAQGRKGRPYEISVCRSHARKRGCRFQRSCKRRRRMRTRLLSRPVRRMPPHARSRRGSACCAACRGCPSSARLPVRLPLVRRPLPSVLTILVVCKWPRGARPRPYLF